MASYTFLPGPLDQVTQLWSFLVLHIFVNSLATLGTPKASHEHQSRARHMINPVNVVMLFNTAEWSVFYMKLEGRQTKTEYIRDWPRVSDHAVFTCIFRSLMGTYYSCRNVWLNAMLSYTRSKINTHTHVHGGSEVQLYISRFPSRSSFRLVRNNYGFAALQKPWILSESKSWKVSTMVCLGWIYGGCGVWDYWWGSVPPFSCNPYTIGCWGLCAYWVCLCVFIGHLYGCLCLFGGSCVTCVGSNL